MMPSFRKFADGAVALSAIPALAATGYLAALTAFSKAKEPPPKPEKLPFFDVVVPAHDEQENIAATVVSLLAVEYPRDRFRIVVVADNCKDQMAARAREAGADVIERFDTEKR